MKTILSAAIGVALFGLATTSADAGMKVRMGTEGAYPPFNYTDDKGQLQGFDIDIGNAICETANLECTWVTQDWDGIIPGLLAKKYDTILASMSITPERMEKIDFSIKYYSTPAKFFAKKGSGYQITKEGLKGKTVGVQRATIHENFLRDNFGDVVTVKSYATQEEAFLDLTSGRIDLGIADSVVVDESFLKTDNGKDYAFVGPNFTDPKWFGEGAGIGIRKGETELREAINAAIKTIRENGTYKKINDKYFDFDVYGD